MDIENEVEDLPQVGASQEPQESVSQDDADDAEFEDTGEEFDASEEGEEDDSDEDGQSDEEADDEWEELDWNGQRRRLPKSVVPELRSMQADYSRKTQEIAEQRRALEEHQQQLAQQVQIKQSLVDDMAEIKAIDATIERYNKVDWAKLEDEDPLTAQKHWRTFQQWKDHRQQKAQTLQQKEQQWSQQQQQHAAKRTEEYQQALVRAMPDWNQDLDQQLTNFARAVGFQDHEIASVRNVNAVRLLRIAYEGWLLNQKVSQQQTAAKTKPKKQVKPLAKPAQGRGPAKGNGLADSLSPEEWARRRNQQEAKRGRFDS